MVVVLRSGMSRWYSIIMKERLSVFTGITLDHLDQQKGLGLQKAGELDDWPTHITVSPPVPAANSTQVDS